jgi:hypothetical protein
MAFQVLLHGPLERVPQNSFFAWLRDKSRNVATDASPFFLLRVSADVLDVPLSCDPGLEIRK